MMKIGDSKAMRDHGQPLDADLIFKGHLSFTGAMAEITTHALMLQSTFRLFNQPVSSPLQALPRRKSVASTYAWFE